MRALLREALMTKRKTFQAMALGLSLTLSLAGCSVTEESTVSESVSNQPKNIIMVVADGMGPAYTGAYRNYADDPSTPNVESVIFDQWLMGMASTYPDSVSGYVTDSAAAATALATGTKSYNGAIGVDVNKQPLKSVMHFAKARGMRTGLAVTSQIVHATPASYIAHNESRRNYNEIADDFYDVRVNGEFVANVMLGGGTSYFEREDRDVLAQFIDAGFEYADSYNRLASVPKGSNVIGLFAPIALPPVLDDVRDNRLEYMTKHAIKHLENPNGFFLLVEASQVDWAGHANDIGSAMTEMDDLALAMAYLQSYVEENPDTLVVLTADHSTGGLTIGAGGDYRWSPNYLTSLKASAPFITTAMVEQESPGRYVEEMLGFELSAEEIAMFDDVAKEDDVTRYTTIKTFLDEKTNTGWTTGGHTGVDVEVFAFGAGHETFAGQIDNTDIAKKIFQMLQNKPMVDVPEVTATPELPVEQGSSGSDGTSDACDFTQDWRCQ